MDGARDTGAVWESGGPSRCWEGPSCLAVPESVARCVHFCLVSPSDSSTQCLERSFSGSESFPLVGDP
jgi:hypothetical protein